MNPPPLSFVNSTPANQNERGFSLVEITVALAIAVFCLVTLLALLPIGVTSNQNAVEQTVAAGFARAIVGDLRVTGTNTTSPTYGITLPTGSTPVTKTLFFTESGAATLALSGTGVSRYRANVTLNPQGSTTFARILITWPAVADPQPGQPPKNYSGSYEAFTAVNSN